MFKKTALRVLLLALRQGLYGLLAKKRVCVALLIAVVFVVPVQAEIANPGFEDGWQGWVNGDSSGSGTALSGEANTGERSVKLSEKSAYVAQVVNVAPNTSYVASVQVKGVGNLGVKIGSELFFEQKEKRGRGWGELSLGFNSGDYSQVTLFASFAGREARFDDFNLKATDEAVAPGARIISSASGGYGLSPDLPPGKNFDLLGWYLNTPGDKNRDGISDKFSEIQLAKGASDERYFFTGPDGGMVFVATVSGGKTSANTSFTRSELRGMLRRGDTSIATHTKPEPNKNNWVFSSAPARAQKKAGGVDGRLFATLAVDYVTTTGDAGQVGRVIVGQIHAKDDEPIRLYYRKLPGNERGSIYAAHEISDGDDVWYEMIGSKARSAPDPQNGIALGQKFSYEILAEANELKVTIFDEQGDRLAHTTIDMSNSGYDVAGDFMYFKAGVYNQNNTGDPEDYVRATFYQLETSHDVYRR